MQERYKKLAALVFDGISVGAFTASLYSVSISTLPTFPPKEIGVLEDVGLLGLQFGEIVRDLKSKKFENKSKLSQAWHTLKKYGAPFLIGAAAAYAVATSRNPEYYLATISDVAWVIGLGSQFIKDRILYRH